MKLMPFLKIIAWLACGTVLAQFSLSLAAMLSMTGAIPGKIIPVALTLILAALIGVLLCRRAPRSHTYLMGLVIASYLPLLLGGLWVVAFIQDLFRGQGLPGESLRAMASYPPNTSLMLAMALIAAVVLTAGRLSARALAPGQTNRK